MAVLKYLSMNKLTSLEISSVCFDMTWSSLPMSTIHESLSQQNSTGLCFHSAGYAETPHALQDLRALILHVASSQSSDHGVDFSTGICLLPACRSTSRILLGVLGLNKFVVTACCIPFHPQANTRKNVAWTYSKAQVNLSFSPNYSQIHPTQSQPEIRISDKIQS